MVINSVGETTGHAARQRPGLDAPPATRVRRPRWRNPQLVVGALMVLVSVVVGVRVVAAADDTVPVLVAARDLSPGQRLEPGMVENRQVALEGGLGRYYTGPVGDGYVVRRHVQAGELLPRLAVVPADDVSAGPEALRMLTLALPATEVPATLATGDAVDVWVTPADGGTGTAERAAAELTVTGVDVGGALGIDGGRARVTLAVRGGDDGPDELVARLIAAARADRVYLSKLP